MEYLQYLTPDNLLQTSKYSIDYDMIFTYYCRNIVVANSIIFMWTKRYIHKDSTTVYIGNRRIYCCSVMSGKMDSIQKFKSVIRQMEHFNGNIIISTAMTSLNSMVMYSRIQILDILSDKNIVTFYKGKAWKNDFFISYLFMNYLSLIPDSSLLAISKYTYYCSRWDEICEIRINCNPDYVGLIESYCRDLTTREQMIYMVCRNSFHFTQTRRKGESISIFINLAKYKYKINFYNNYYAADIILIIINVFDTKINFDINEHNEMNFMIRQQN